jgi:hypothetical protein
MSLDLKRKIQTEDQEQRQKPSKPMSDGVDNIIEIDCRRKEKSMRRKA